jgi:hypothetical protein
VIKFVFFLLHTAFVLRSNSYSITISTTTSYFAVSVFTNRVNTFFLNPSWIAPIAASLIQQPILGGINVRDNPFYARTFLAQFAMLFVLTNPTSFVITKRPTLWIKTRFPYQLCALRGKRNLESLVPLVARP